MSLKWPSLNAAYEFLPDGTRDDIRTVLDEYGKRLGMAFAARGIPLHASPLWQPWSLFVGVNGTQVVAVFFSPKGGLPELHWAPLVGDPPTGQLIAQLVKEDYGWDSVLTLEWDVRNPFLKLEGQVLMHVEDIEARQALGRLGDLSNLEHLTSPLRSFLEDHATYERNVFVMMRFAAHAQLAAVFDAIQSTLSTRGFKALRADQRDYTGELWSNVQTYMHGCKYSIAVFEDFTGSRDFNPNVSLELGYMIARNKRTLILKEQTLPNIPADVVHRLYRPFDMFNVDSTIESQVGRWIDVDLGHARA